MHFQSLTGEWTFRQAGTDEWMPAIVPGGVHTDLLALGRIPNPFVSDNKHAVMWVAEVRLNGEILGRADNQFRRWRWEVKDRLDVGENTLEIGFSSPTT